MAVTKEEFDAAVAQSKQLSSRPDNATLLKLYSLYKQATEGDATAESEAGMFDFIAKAKWNAWDALRGKSKETAMDEYVGVFKTLQG